MVDAGCKPDTKSALLGNQVLCFSRLSYATMHIEKLVEFTFILHDLE